MEEFDRLCESGDYIKVIEWLQKRYRENDLDMYLWSIYAKTVLGVEKWEGVEPGKIRSFVEVASAKACAYGFMAEFCYFKGKIDEALHYASVGLQESPNDLFSIKQASSIMILAKSILHPDEIDQHTNATSVEILADITILIEEFNEMTSAKTNEESNAP